MFEPIMNVDVWLLSELLVPGTQIPLNVVSTLKQSRTHVT